MSVTTPSLLRRALTVLAAALLFVLGPTAASAAGPSTQARAGDRPANFGSSRILSRVMNAQPGSGAVVLARAPTGKGSRTPIAQRTFAHLGITIQAFKVADTLYGRTSFKGKPARWIRLPSRAEAPSKRPSDPGVSPRAAGRG